MRKYRATSWIALKNAIAYGWGIILIYHLSGLLSLIAIAAVWLASNSNGLIGGFTKSELVTYYIVGMIIGPLIFWYPTTSIREEISEGLLSSQVLSKPLDYILYKFFQELGWHTISSSMGIFSAAIAFSLFGNYFIFNLAGQLVLVGLAIVGSAVLIFSVSYCLGLLAFWLTEIEEFTNILWLGIALLGGELIPISFFPETIRTFLTILPFRYMFSFPLEIYTGKLELSNTALGFTAQISWVLLFLLLGRLLWKRGVKVYSSYGG